MDKRYQTLQSLFALVKDTPHPAQYQCLPRQLILACEFDWEMIYAHLVKLEKQGLVKIIQADNIQFSITMAGIEKVTAILSA